MEEMRCDYCDKVMDYRGCQNKRCQDQAAAESKAEMDAENGWLRQAEMGSFYDDPHGF